MARKRLDLIGVIGELLITAGVITILFVVWQVFINDPVVSAKQQFSAENFSKPTQVEKPQFREINGKLQQGQVFGKMFIPRFDKNYERLVGQGTLQKVTLNEIGIGHYIKSQWPGEVGNFAVAAHRTSYGAPFGKIDTLRNGDLIFVQTNTHWFTYKYLQTKIVRPNQIGVISEVPQGLIGAKAGGKYMTLTSCHPKWSNSQRIVVWLELAGQQAITDGEPLELLKLKAK